MSGTGNYNVDGRVSFYINGEWESEFIYETFQQRRKSIETFLLGLRGREDVETSYYIIEVYKDIMPHEKITETKKYVPAESKTVNVLSHPWRNQSQKKYNKSRRFINNGQ